MAPRKGAWAALPAPRSTRVLFLLALAKACLGIAVLLPVALLAPDPRLGPWGDTLQATLLVLFAAVGGFLFLGGRRDRRSLYWGGALLLVADALAGGPLGRLDEALSPGLFGRAARALEGLSLEVFLPAVLWRLTLLFTRLPDPPDTRRALESTTRAYWWGGTALLALQAWSLLGPEGPRALERLSAQVSRSDPHSLYYPLIAAAALPPLTLLARRVWLYGHQQRLFIAWVLFGIFPVTAAALVRPLLPAGAFDDPRALIAIGSPLLLIPLATGWAWAVGRLFAMHPVAFRELQYAAMRGLLAVGVAIPLLFLGFFALQERDRTLAELSSSWAFLSLALLAVAATLIFSRRRRLLALFERRLFPELETHLTSLPRLLDRLETCSTVAELAALLEKDLQRQLSIDGAALLVRSNGALAHPLDLVRPLEAASSLASLLVGREALEVDLEDPLSPLRDLPLEERYWLVDSGARLLVALRGARGELLAFLLLREKPSELPFLPRERDLLSSLAGGAALALELVVTRQSGVSRGPAKVGWPAGGFEPARECTRCGRIHTPSADRCSRCNGSLEEISLPHVLPGRLRLERRIGTGRMGILYRARDFALGRSLAVKTLPRLSPEDALRLRREARTAAAVSHPNLEVIYGVETWRGTPMILIELLEGGKLRSRLRQQPRMEITEALELGVGLLGALEQLHRRGILHRDVKPGNIVYSSTGLPKLVDFDLARLTHDPRSDSWEVVPRHDGRSRRDSSSSSSYPSLRRADWMESLYYRSPETVAGAPPDESADLWSLHAVLYECLSGRRVFTSRKLPDLLREIQEASIPSLDESLENAPAMLTSYFAAALDRDPSQRPSSAREARQALAKMQHIGSQGGTRKRGNEKGDTILNSGT